MWCARQCSRIFSYLDSFNTQVFFERGSIIMAIYTWKKVSWVTLGVKNPPASAGDLRGMGSIPGSRRSPGAGHGNPLQWVLHTRRISWTEEPGGLWATGSQRVRHIWSNLVYTHRWKKVDISIVVSLSNVT